MFIALPAPEAPMLPDVAASETVVPCTVPVPVMLVAAETVALVVIPVPMLDPRFTAPVVDVKFTVLEFNVPVVTMEAEFTLIAPLTAFSAPTVNAVVPTRLMSRALLPAAVPVRVPE